MLKNSRQLNFIILGGALLLLFCFFILTIAAKFDLTTSFDFDTTVRIQDHMPERLKPYLISFVELGSWQVMSVAVFISMLIHRKHFWKIGLLYLFIALIEVYGKYQLQHPPPPEMFVLRFEHLNLPDNYVRNEASFPSGHAARSAFLVFLWIPFIFSNLFSYIKRHTEKVISEFKLRLPFGFVLSRENALSFEIVDFARIAFFIGIFIALLSFTFIVGFIKVYIGEHWMSDVIGGWLLGSGLGIFATIQFKKHIFGLTSHQ
jgi:membrane-associated phospholipid phosphatase